MFWKPVEGWSPWLTSGKGTGSGSMSGVLSILSSVSRLLGLSGSPGRGSSRKKLMRSSGLGLTGFRLGTGLTVNIKLKIWSFTIPPNNSVSVGTHCEKTFYRDYTDTVHAHTVYVCAGCRWGFWAPWNDFTLDPPPKIKSCSNIERPCQTL